MKTILLTILLTLLVYQLIALVVIEHNNENSKITFYFATALWSIPVNLIIIAYEKVEKYANPTYALLIDEQGNYWYCASNTADSIIAFGGKVEQGKTFAFPTNDICGTLYENYAQYYNKLYVFNDMKVVNCRYTPKKVLKKLDAKPLDEELIKQTELISADYEFI